MTGHLERAQYNTLPPISSSVVSLLEGDSECLGQSVLRTLVRALSGAEQRVTIALGWWGCSYCGEAQT